MGLKISILKLQITNLLLLLNKTSQSVIARRPQSRRSNLINLDCFALITGLAMTSRDVFSKLKACTMLTKIKILLKKFWQLALDTIFPIECLICKKEGKTICDGCLPKIPLTNRADCPLCHKLSSPSQRLCLDCQKSSGLKDIIVATDYFQTPIEDLIHGLKYNFLTTNTEVLAYLLFQKIKELPIHQFSTEKIIIVPVPLHKKRERERGFNQAELIAQELQKLWPVKIEKLLINRQRYTTTQTELSREERQKNIKDAFAISDQTNLQNKTIIILDDVITTGSTILEIAKLFKDSGAINIYALTVAQN